MLATTLAIDTVEIPAWGVMWAICLGMFGTLKLLTWRSADTAAITRTAAAAYFIAWPGMDPTAFRRTQSAPTFPTRREWIAAATKTLLGVGLVTWSAARAASHPPLVIGWIGLIGFGFLLHFGIFHLLALGWRAAGVPVEPLMNRPWFATSLGDFWDRRWNRAFRDLSERLILRPLTPTWGSRTAMFAVFAVSGLIHEAAISLPARGGYGGPTLYFMLQAIVMQMQRNSAARRWKLNRGLAGWIITAVTVLGPVGILFHSPFITRVIFPFLDVLAGG